MGYKRQDPAADLNKVQRHLELSAEDAVLFQSAWKQFLLLDAARKGMGKKK
jgi:hypothetical protein